MWDQKDLLESDYPVGTKIVDHFEVVERTPDKVQNSKHPIKKPINTLRPKLNKNSYYNVHRNVDSRVYQVVLRCGDSPDVQEIRETDGVFILEVTKDKDEATFHMKSIFFTGLPNQPDIVFPWYIKRAHMEYDKLFMETSVRKLLR